MKPPLPLFIEREICCELLFGQTIQVVGTVFFCCWEPNIFRNNTRFSRLRLNRPDNISIISNIMVTLLLSSCESCKIIGWIPTTKTGSKQIVSKTNTDNSGREKVQLQVFVDKPILIIVGFEFWDDQTTWRVA